MRREDMIDWNDPHARADLVRRVGISEYERRFKEYCDANTAGTENGYRIRPIVTQYGRVFIVEGLGRGAPTLEAAIQIARNAPPAGYRPKKQDGSEE